VGLPMPRPCGGADETERQRWSNRGRVNKTTDNPPPTRTSWHSHLCLSTPPQGRGCDSRHPGHRVPRNLQKSVGDNRPATGKITLLRIKSAMTILCNHRKTWVKCYTTNERFWSSVFLYFFTIFFIFNFSGFSAVFIIFLCFQY